VQENEQLRQYWEKEFRAELFARIAALPPKPGKEAIRAKLKQAAFRSLDLLKQLPP